MTRKKSIERPLPLVLNRVESSGFRRRALCVLTLMALAEVGSARAACAPASTSHGDTIVCSGSQTEALVAKSGDDSISILPGASIGVTSAQSATAVDAGSGNDSVVNDGRVSVTLAPPATAPAGKSSTCSASGDLQGVGIAGGGGFDLINNRGAIAVQTTGSGGTQPQCDSSQSESKHDNDDDHGHPPLRPAGASIGILGDSGNDRINNSGSVTVGASSDASSPQVIAKGIVGGNGDDTIVNLNTGTIAVTASSTAASSAPPDTAAASASSKQSHSSKPQDISETGLVNAVGIEGGNGNDILRSDGALTVTASETSSSSTRSLTLLGGDNVTATTTLETRAVGITGGAGRDTISNTGNLTVNATSDASSVGVSVTLVDLSRSNTSTFVLSTATGIDAGSGKDNISVSNTGTIAANATSKNSGVSVEVNFADAATGDSAVVVQSTATGIVGGQGRNTVDVGGAVKATATSQSSDVSVNVSYVDATIADTQISNTSTTVESKATGIDGSRGGNNISIGAAGSVDAAATSTLHSLGVSFSVEGVSQATRTVFTGGSIASTGIVSSSTATGVVGGGQDDTVTNAGSVTASATSTSTQNNIGIGMTAVELTIPTPSINLVGAGTEAHATATGIDAGGGGNTILNSGLVKSDATASATAGAFSINLGVFALNLPGNPPGIPLSAALVVADTLTAASAQSAGIVGGSGDDSIRNSGAVQTQATASAVSLAVSASAKIELEEGEKLFAAAAVAARAGTAATSQAVGIDAGAGSNQVSNDAGGSVTVGAAAKGTAVGVAVNVAGTFDGSGAILGLSATDTSSTAAADATGIRGGSDHDRVSNAGSVGVTSTADVTSVSASVAASYAKEGLVIGVGLARAESIATANATGIDGAGGLDEIENTGSIAATAKAHADAVGVSLSLAGTQKGVAGGAAVTDTSTTVTAAATGIRGGGAKGDERDRDDDWYRKYGDSSSGRISNAGAINADAQANALNVNASASVAVSTKEGGLVLGVGLARAESNATATAIGIDGAGGNGEIDNTGTITAKATANANAVGVSLAVAGNTDQGVAGGAALTDTRTTATATSVGIRSGDAAEGRDKDEHDGHDDKDSDGRDKHDDKDGYGYVKHDDDKNGPISNAKSISVEAQANALSVGVSANVSIAKEGVALGAALANTSTHATALAKGIEANAGNDEIGNDGTIAVKSGASGTAVSVSLTVEGTAKGLAAGAALVDASVNAASTAVGIDGGAGDDSIGNRGSISIDKAQASATAVGVAAAVVVAKQGAALGAALSDTSATAAAVATGIDGGAGNDVLTNTGSITAQNVGADATAVAVSLSVALSKEGVGAGAALAKGDSNATATATGMDGGSGNDELLNQGSITLQGVKTDATAVSVSLAVAGAKDGLAVSAALVDADATATTTATGMAGGSGNDKLSNLGSIAVSDIKADANAVGVSVSATFSQNGAVVAAALAKTGTTASATAKGLDGGAGDDSLSNAGSVTLQQVNADADAVSVSVGLSAAQNGVTIAAGLADASGKATAIATGLDGGADNDTVVNSGTGKISVEDVGASASAAGISVALSGSSVGVSAGAALADTSGNATSTAKGMDGGAGNDTLLNDGAIALKRTTSDADSISVGVSLTASLSAGVSAGAALSRAGATANATAVGMDGGSGNDWMLNRGSITVDGVTANANAISVSAQLGITNVGAAVGAALADTSSNATATAKGMDGGAGDDWLRNEGQITLQNVKADAGGVSVSATLNGAITGGVAAGVALTDGRVTAVTTATGMDGGAGSDVLSNAGTIKLQGVESHASAVGVSVTANVSMAGIAGGGAVADMSTTARTTAKGMDGGAGDDTIVNTGAIDVQGKSRAETVSVAVNISAALGVALGAEVSKANTTAETTAIGIDAGSGRDQVSNAGSIGVQADAQSKAASVSVGISVGVGGDATLAEATTSATATAIGINQVGGDASGGTNVIVNTGAVSALATSKSAGVSVGADLHGLSMGNTTNTAAADAAAIRLGDGKDQIRNEGAITAASDANATGLSVSVTGAGKSVGDASSTAQAGAAGIQTGGGDDEISNLAAVNASARSSASALSVSVTLAGVSGANASTKSLATATGIDGGSGKDTIVNHASVTASAGDAGAIAAADCTTAGGACANSSSVSVTLAGTGSVDATTTARSTATGVAGGADDDSIYSDGAISASARAKTTADSVNVGIFGATQSSLDTTASATATGISGGDGNDVIETHSTIKAASASHIAISGSGFGFDGSGGFNATLSASATATAIDGGAGNDKINNDAALTVAAAGTLSSSGGSTVVFGSSGANATSGAFTDAAGIRAGAGDDQVWNGGAIDVRSSASLSLSSSSFTFGGTGGTNGALTASTQATGIAGGSGRDSIANQGNLSVNASSSLVSSGGSSVAFGSTGAGASSGAVTAAAGIDGGDDDDIISNKGRVTAISSASLSMDNSSFSFGGTGGTSGSLTATTQSTGIAGGKGRDGIVNEGELFVSAGSSLVSSGGSNVAFGTSGAGASSGAVTSAVGIDGGDDDDVIFNKGRITAISSASLSLSSSSFSFGGTGGTSGSLTASTQSTGIAGGKGRDSITNEGELIVSASSTQVSSGGSNVAFGTSGAGANSGAVTTTVGIDGGDGDDFIHNKALITVGSNASLSMDSSSFSFGGTGGTSGSLTASTQATGIAGGSGRDSITNEGEINVRAGSSLVSTGGSSVGFGTSGAGSDSGAVTSVAGIDGGDGDNVILNKGRVTASADAALSLDSSSFSFAGSGGVSGTLTATTRSVGLRGGDGNDAIQNDGDVVVRATSDLHNSGGVSTSLGGAADASGESTSTLSARGIDGGAGDNWIANNGTIDVKAAANTASTLSSSSGFFAGQSTTIAVSRTDMTAVGIDVGHGNNTLLNAGSIAVELSGAVATTANSDGSSLGADADSNSRSVLTATAVGISAGNGANQITNTGSIAVQTWAPFNILDLTFELPVQATAGGHGEGHGIGDATVFISAETSVFAAGISAGNGANTIRNEGSIAVDLRATAKAVGSTDPGGTGGDGESHSDTLISARAVGIAAGDGANQITNTGSINVMTSLTTRSETFAIGHIDGDADALSTAKTNVFAAGIDVGNGSNTIRNEGAINVTLGAVATTLTDTDAGNTGGDNFDFSRALVSAQGYGIHAGSGNNTIVNKGTINVTVIGTASINFASCNCSASVAASAIGIGTGAGNDTIVNEGKITATTIVNGVSSPGTAISSGAGDDTVTLKNGSVTNGNIDLGTGNNRLVLEGTPVINGTVIDGSATLGLVFNSAGSFNGALPGWSATKNGPGTFTVSALNKMQRIEVNQGTLKVDNDYTFMSGGMFQAKVGGDGSYGRFFVNGWAALDGTMKIVRGDGAYVNGATFDVLKASNGIQAGTAFSRVELPEDTRLLKFRTEQLSDSVRVKADVASFTTVAGTPNQMAVASNLDRILPRTSGSLNQLLGKIQAMPDGQFASAFASLSPAVYAGYTASTFNTVQQYSNVLQDRMTALRAGDLSSSQGSFASKEPIRLAYAGKGLSDLLDAGEAERARSSGVWLRAFSQKGEQNATDGISGYDYRMAGTSFGYDHRFTSNLTAGVGVGVAKNKTNAGGDVTSQGDIDSTMGSLYAGYFDQRVYANGVLSGGRNKYDTSRTLVDQSTATSSHTGDVLAAALGAGFYAKFDAWWVEPYATVQYTRLNENGFSETGSTANQTLEARSTTGVVSTLGARLSRPIQDGNGATWVPQASLAWLHDYSKNQVINASYVGAPDSSFSIDGQPVQRNGALVGFAISYRSKGGMTTTFQYTGEFRDQFAAHGLAGEFRFEF